MASLREVQAAFRAGILEGEDAPLAPLLVSDGLTAAQRLQVYRNNTFISLRAALEATFPVVRRLVGEGFFAMAARGFIRERPPASPCLADYGGGFAEFLAGYAPARALVYLADVARLEWALNEAAVADDAVPLRLQALAAIAPHRYPQLRFTLHPSVRLLESRFPVERIWRANQPGSESRGVIDLGQGGCTLVAARADGRVAVHSIPAAEFCTVAALAAGETLAAAYERALRHDPDFVPTAILHRLLSNGFLVDFLLPQTAPGG